MPYISSEKLNRKEHDIKLLFFTCATKFYDNFIIPYCYFAAKHNPSSAFEFIIDDVEDFKKKHSLSIKWLTENFKIPIFLRAKKDELNLKVKLDNSIRFVLNPKTTSEYVYIGDVDIIILEEILKKHAPIFDLGLPYSNVVREIRTPTKKGGGKRLTGLHLCKSQSQYPLGAIDDLIEKFTNDEELLYAIMERKKLLYSNDVTRSLKIGRPSHGIHLSLNRLPFSYHKERPDWNLHYIWLEKFMLIAITNEFKDFFETLYEGSQQILINLVYLSEGSSVIGREKFGKFPY
jgi:hypothetical protein